MSATTRLTNVVHLDPRLAADPKNCLVSIYGIELGKQYLLSPISEFSIGREDGNDLVIPLDTVSRRHAVLRTAPGGVTTLADLESSNGTFVNEVRVGAAPVELRSGDLLRVGRAMLKFLSGGNIETLYHDALYQLTIVDALTGAFNKRHFLARLKDEMARGSRYARPLSLLLFDIDHFKRVNDTHGHIVGDYVLRELAQVVRGAIRRNDVFARYGGEEFAVIAPELDVGAAADLAEKLRHEVEHWPFEFGGALIPVTISVGVADNTAEPDDVLGFVKVADDRLYAAKRSGRNRVRAS